MIGESPFLSKSKSTYEGINPKSSILNTQFCLEYFANTINSNYPSRREKRKFPFL